MISVDINHKVQNFELSAQFQTDSRGITAIFGRSGAGKTSIVNALAGLLTPDSGRIEIDGEVLLDTEKVINLPPQKRRLHRRPTRAKCPRPFGKPWWGRWWS